jgi:hypothetical protein
MFFRLSPNEEACESRNNIFYVTTKGGSLAMIDDTGALPISHNWLKPSWRKSRTARRLELSLTTTLPF